MGITDASGELWKKAHFVSMRRWAGQDISCLNLTKPTTPTILSVPAEMMQPPDAKVKHRFEFSPGSPDNPWALLDQPQSDGSIPVIADQNTASYILNLEIGQTLPIPDAAGATRSLKLVATLNNSIFQSEMLMSEANFRRLFPTQQGFGVVLAECPARAGDDAVAASDQHAIGRICRRCPTDRQSPGGISQHREHLSFDVPGGGAWQQG